MAKEEKDMAQKDGITFEIKGNDLKNVNKFCKQHKNCFHGAAGEQFVYSFLPTGLGLLTTVKCSCGQTLEIGDFMDYDSGGYDEEKCRVLTEEDHVRGELRKYDCKNKNLLNALENKNFM